MFTLITIAGIYLVGWFGTATLLARMSFKRTTVCVLGCSYRPYSEYGSFRPHARQCVDVDRPESPGLASAQALVWPAVLLLLAVKVAATARPPQTTLPYRPEDLEQLEKSLGITKP